MSMMAQVIIGRSSMFHLLLGQLGRPAAARFLPSFRARGGGSKVGMPATTISLLAVTF
jgi:hypothetical protein